MNLERSTPNASLPPRPTLDNFQFKSIGKEGSSLLDRISSPQRHISPSPSPSPSPQPESSVRSSESHSSVSTRAASRDSRSVTNGPEMATVGRSRTGSVNPTATTEQLSAHVKTEQASNYCPAGVTPAPTTTTTTTDLPQWTALSLSSPKDDVSSTTFEVEQDELCPSFASKSQHTVPTINNALTTTNGSVHGYIPLQITNTGASTTAEQSFAASINVDDSIMSEDATSLESSFAAATDRIRSKIAQHQTSSPAHRSTIQYEDLAAIARKSLEMAESSKECAAMAVKIMDLLLTNVKKAQEEASNAAAQSKLVLDAAEAAMRNLGTGSNHDQVFHQVLVEADAVTRLSCDILAKQKELQSTSQHNLEVARAEAEQFRREAIKEREERQRLEEIIRSRTEVNAAAVAEDARIQSEASMLPQSEEAEGSRKQFELRKVLEERRRKEEEKQAQEEYQRRRAAYWEQKIKQQDDEAAKLRQQRGEHKTPTLSPGTEVEQDHQLVAGRLSNKSPAFASNRSVSVSGNDIRLSEPKSRASTIQNAIVLESMSSSQTLLDPLHDNTQAIHSSRPRSLPNPIADDGNAWSERESMVISIAATPPLSQPSPAALRHLAPRQSTPSFVKANIKREPTSPPPDLSEGLATATRAYSDEPTYANTDQSDLRSPPAVTSNYDSRDLTPPLPESRDMYTPEMPPSPPSAPSVHSPPPAQEPSLDSRSFRDDRSHSNRPPGGHSVGNYSPSSGRQSRFGPMIVRTPPLPAQRLASDNYVPLPSSAPPRDNMYPASRTGYHGEGQFDDIRRSGSQNSLKRRRDDSPGPSRSAPSWGDGPGHWEARSYGGDSVSMADRRSSDYDGYHGSQRTSSYSARDTRPVYDNSEDSGYGYSDHQQQRPIPDRAEPRAATPPLSSRRQQQRLLSMNQPSGPYRSPFERASNIGIGNHTFENPRSDGSSSSPSFYRDNVGQGPRQDSYGGSGGIPPKRPFRDGAGPSHPPPSPLRSQSYRPRSQSPPPPSSRVSLSARVDIHPSESHNSGGIGTGPSLADRITRSRIDTASGYYDSHPASSSSSYGGGESGGPPLRSLAPRGRGRGRGRGNYNSSNSYHTSARGHKQSQLLSRFS